MRLYILSALALFVGGCTSKEKSTLGGLRLGEPIPSQYWEDVRLYDCFDPPHARCTFDIEIAGLRGMLNVALVGSAIKTAKVKRIEFRHCLGDENTEFERFGPYLDNGCSGFPNWTYSAAKLPMSKDLSDQYAKLCKTKGIWEANKVAAKLESAGWRPRPISARVQENVDYSAKKLAELQPGTAEYLKIEQEIKSHSHMFEWEDRDSRWNHRGWYGVMNYYSAQYAKAGEPHRWLGVGQLSGGEICEMSLSWNLPDDSNTTDPTGTQGL